MQQFYKIAQLQANHCFQNYHQGFDNMPTPYFIKVCKCFKLWLGIGFMRQIYTASCIRIAFSYTNSMVKVFYVTSILSYTS